MELNTDLDAMDYLKNTDWVVMKLAEAEAGITTEDVKTKYAEVFITRIEARAKINQLQSS